MPIDEVSNLLLNGRSSPINELLRLAVFHQRGDGHLNLNTPNHFIIARRGPQPPSSYDCI